MFRSKNKNWINGGIYRFLWPFFFAKYMFSIIYIFFFSFQKRRFLLLKNYSSVSIYTRARYWRFFFFILVYIILVSCRLSYFYRVLIVVIFRFKINRKLNSIFFLLHSHSQLNLRYFLCVCDIFTIMLWFLVYFWFCENKSKFNCWKQQRVFSLYIYPKIDVEFVFNPNMWSYGPCLY